jgi:hypothetical protein
MNPADKFKNGDLNKFDNIKFDSVQNSEQAAFEKSVRAYVSQYSPVLIILTPTYGSVCFVNYLMCLMHTVSLCSQFNIPVRVEFCRNDSLVSRARNNLIAKAMHDEKATHFMFIDADITWSAIDVIRLLMHNKPLSGGVYPHKHYDFQNLIGPKENGDVLNEWLVNKSKSQITRDIPMVDYLQHKILRYNINYISNTLEVKNNLTQVKHLATGFMLIQRQVIEKMSMAFPSTKYTDDVGFLQGDENKYAYALFDCGVEEGHYYSEDWLFCSRWTKMGGDVWIDVSINLTHTGISDYRGSFLASVA